MDTKLTKQDKIYLTPPHIDHEEKQMMEEVLASNWIAPSGPHLELFEEMLSIYFHGRRVLLLNSGTAAIHVALKLLNIQTNDLVVCSDFTFSASANPILYEKAIPVFVDSENVSWGMDPQKLEETLSKLDHKPKAIILVHAYGVPANTKRIKEIAGNYDIPLIEDAAECLGAQVNGHPCGLDGDFGVISFNGNKIVTTGGGGALIFKNKDHYDKALSICMQGHTRGDYTYDNVGYNYRMSNVAAGLGIAQFRKLKEKVDRKRYIFEQYKKEIGRCIDVTFQPEYGDVVSNRWLSNVLFESTEIDVGKIVKAMGAVGIEVRPIWKPLHLQQVYAGSYYFGGNVGQNLALKGLSLPSGTSLNDSDQERVIDTLLKLVKS